MRMPAEELAPCGYGAFGTCCCTCRHHLPVVNDKYACLYFVDGDYVHILGEHGMCEGYERRN